MAEDISGVGFLVTEGTGNVLSDNTTSNSRIGFGTWQPGVSENSFLRNASIDNWKAFEDQTRGFDGDAGTRNHYTFNSCVRTGTGGSTPEGLCR